MFSASAPAKIILFGEHAVVYGQPAIAVPVSSLRARAEVQPNAGEGLRIIAGDLGEVIPVTVGADMVDSALFRTAQLVLQAAGAAVLPDVTITLSSDIPMASGLGSGAAVTTALARGLLAALGVTLSVDELNQLVYRVEQIYHGTPSGVDNTVIVYEQPVYFVRGESLEMLSVAQPMTFVIADTGEASPTRFAVADVRRLYDQQPEQIGSVIAEIGSLARMARQALETDGDLSLLGQLMNQNHALLQQLTVSSERLDRLVEAARKAGAFGAKLSGGGRGGNMIALCQPDNHQQIEAALKACGAKQTYSMSLGVAV